MTDEPVQCDQRHLRASKGLKVNTPVFHPCNLAKFSSDRKCAVVARATNSMPGRDLRFSIDRGGTFTDVFVEVNSKRKLSIGWLTTFCKCRVSGDLAGSSV